MPIMYSLNNGREGLLITQDGASYGYTLTRDVALVNDNIVCDPIRLHNALNGQYLWRFGTEYELLKARAGVDIYDAFDAEAVRLARQGYTVFEMPGKVTDQRYGFAVIIGEMDSEMD